MRAPRSLPLALAFGALASLTFAAADAGAIVVERVVAIVGDKPILLSELRTRARPFLVQVQKNVPAGPQQAAAESQVFKELIEKIIDEELELQAAEKAKLSVQADEVDNAFKNIAASQGVTVAEVYRDAQVKSGLTEADYREEIRRQILEGKMLQLRVKGRVRITEEDVKSMYERYLKDEKKRLEYRPAWIVLRVLPGSSPQAVAERKRLAEQLAERARHGEAFADLARAYSDDTPTRAAGGDLGIRAPRETRAASTAKFPVMAPELEAVLVTLDVGQVSAPTVAGDAVVVLTLLARQAGRFPTFDGAKQQMLNAVQNEILEKAKRKWLDELKARTHLDVRL